VGEIDRIRRKHPAEIEVADIRPFEGFPDRGFVFLRGRDDPVFGDIAIERPEIDLRDDVIAFLTPFVFVGADDPDRVAFRLRILRPTAIKRPSYRRMAQSRIRR
jgi:hypothetical protein